MVPASACPPNRRLRTGSLLREAGFARVRQFWQGRRDELDSEEFWDVQVVYSSAERLQLQQASAQEVDALKQDFLARCQRLRANAGKLIYPHSAMLYSAMRP
jgi:hypothetical protein